MKDYISRVSSLQQLAGLGPVVRTPWARKVLAGLRNLEESRPSRLAVTPAIMRDIKSALTRSGWPRARRRTVWSASCLLFHGSLRAVELLPEAMNTWAPDATLMGSDVEIRRNKVDGVWVRWISLRSGYVNNFQLILK